MAQVIEYDNGVPVIKLKEVVIGSQFKFAVFFERLVSEDPDVFEPFDFTGMTLQADVKDRPSKDVTADAEITCTPRTGLDIGWVDFYMSGDVTGTLLQKEYNASIKVWPTGSPEQGDTLLSLILPMRYEATR